MRFTLLACTLATAALACGLGACTSTNDGPSGSGLSQTFDTSNYRRGDTNGTQTRPDVYRQFTQPTMPSITNRGN